jgi:hypothetical protein
MLVRGLSLALSRWVLESIDPNMFGSGWWVAFDFIMKTQFI